MRNSEKFIEGLTQQEALDGFPVSSMGGDAGGPVFAVDCFCSAIDFPPGHSPCNLSAFDETDDGPADAVHGTLGILQNMVNTGDDSLFDVAGGAQWQWVKPGSGEDCSIWESSVSAIVSSSPFPYPGVTVSFTLAALVYELADFTTGLTDEPHDLTASDPTWDGEKGQTTLSFEYDNADNEDPVGLGIVRAKDGGPTEFVGTVKFVDGQTEYEYIDTVLELGSYEYTIVAYEYLPFQYISPESAPLVIEFLDSLPDIDVIGDLSIAIDFSDTTTFIGDPSGIYTLVPGKSHDTLYNRPGAVTTIEVKIPDPFVKLGFIP